MNAHLTTLQGHYDTAEEWKGDFIEFGNITISNKNTPLIKMTKNGKESEIHFRTFYYNLMSAFITGRLSSSHQTLFQEKEIIQIMKLVENKKIKLLNNFNKEESVIRLRLLQSSGISHISRQSKILIKNYFILKNNPSAINSDELSALIKNRITKNNELMKRIIGDKPESWFADEQTHLKRTWPQVKEIYGPNKTEKELKDALKKWGTLSAEEKHVQNLRNKFRDELREQLMSSHMTMLSKNDYLYPEAAHIVPVKYLKKMKRYNDILDPSNGILLDPNTHTRLDKKRADTSISLDGEICDGQEVIGQIHPIYLKNTRRLEFIKEYNQLKSNGEIE